VKWFTRRRAGDLAGVPLRLLIFDFVENRFESDILHQFADFGIPSVLTPNRSAIANTIVTSLATSCSAKRLICRSSLARFSAAAVSRS
jgi:hypothetical protein